MNNNEEPPLLTSNDSDTEMFTLCWTGAKWRTRNPNDSTFIVAAQLEVWIQITKDNFWRHAFVSRLPSHAKAFNNQSRTLLYWQNTLY